VRLAGFGRPWEEFDTSTGKLHGTRVATFHVSRLEDHMEYLGTHSQPVSQRFRVSCLVMGLFFKEPDHDEELKTNPAKELRLSAGTHRLGKERISRWVSS